MKIIFALIAALLFIACESPIESPTLGEKERLTSTRYVRDSVSSKTCWMPWVSNPDRDSLFINGKGYTISSRSRYRLETLPSAYLDVLAEGPVFNGDWAIYRDTKSDSIYIFTDCESLKMFNGKDF